jgi:predicted permease
VPGLSENMKIYRNVVAPGYFDLMKIPLAQGRDFTERDDEKSLPVTIVSQAFARRFLPGRNPVGHRVRGWGRWFTIVGVARDIRYHGFAEGPMPFFYVPFLQIYRPDIPITVYVRTARAPDSVLGMLRREVRSLDAGVAIAGVMPLTEHIGQSLFAQKMAASLLGALGSLALLLAAVGLYSLMAYSVSQRTQEIGIRMALGARPADVRRMVVRQGMALTLAGVVLGLGAALALTRLIAPTLLAVSPTDPAVFLGAATFLAAIALAASYLPARRATKVDPMIALRCQ